MPKLNIVLESCRLHGYHGRGSTPVRACCTVWKACATHVDKMDGSLVQPKLAKADNIVALPALVRRSPEPVRRVIGDLSDSARLLARLDVRNQS